MFDTPTLLALDFVPGVGSQTLKKILTKCKNEEICLSHLNRVSFEELTKHWGFSSKSASLWFEKRVYFLNSAREMLDLLHTYDISISLFLDNEFPKDIHLYTTHGPCFLYLYGNKKLLQSDTFSILSSRKSPEFIHHHISSLTKEAILNGENLVTSGTAPSYSPSYITALKMGSPKIIILDTGFFVAFGLDGKQEINPTFKIWREEFDPITDLAISAFSPFKKFQHGANKQRDYLVASLSKRIDFIHIRNGGNMESIYQKSKIFQKKVRKIDINLNPPF